MQRTPRTQLKEVIRDSNGNPIRYSRNLAGILRYTYGYLAPLITAISADLISNGEGKLCILFDNGNNYETNFASYSVLKNWLRHRRNWYGAPLRVNGQDAETLSYNNPALVEQPEPTTDVCFRMLNGEVIALFPALPGTNSPYTCQSYMQVGQHGSADPEGIVIDSKAATPEQYAPLKAELEAKPYNYRLRIIKRISSKYLELRRKALQEQATTKP